jgi:hypothetical protein
LSGSCIGTGRDIGVNGLHITAAELAAELSAGPGYPVQFKSGLRGVVYHQFRADAAHLNITGSVEKHTIDAGLRGTGFESKLTLSGGYKNGTWQGEITRISGKDAVGAWNLRTAAALRATADSIALARLVIEGAPGENLTADGQVTLNPLRGFFRTEWHSFNLARLFPVLGNSQLTGLSSGALQARLPGGGRMLLTGRAEASGTVQADGHRVNVRQASVQIDWNEREMLSVLDLRLTEGGLFRGRFFSPKPFSMVIPSRGVMDADWQGFDIALLNPWLPRGLTMEGILSGRLKGSLMPGVRFDVSGDAVVSQGGVRWREETSQVAATLSKADLSWGWQGGLQTTGPQSGKFQTSRITLNGNIDASGVATLDGHRIVMQQAALKLDWGDRGMRNELDLNLADGGRLRGSFSSPLPTTLSFPQQGSLVVDGKDQYCHPASLVAQGT